LPKVSLPAKINQIVECTISSEQNVLISLARLRRVKYGRFWLLSGRREIGAEIRELPKNTGRSGNPARNKVKLEMVNLLREEQEKSRLIAKEILKNPGNILIKKLNPKPMFNMV